MRIRTMFVAASTLLLASATDTSAQRFEVQPLVGGRFGGSFEVRERVPDGFRGVDLSLDSGVVWGATFGVFVTEDVELEFMWTRHEHAVNVEQRGRFRTRVFDATANQYHGNILFHFLDSRDRLRPYVLFGLGGTTFDPEPRSIESLSRFSFGFGGGLKAEISEHLGVRVQGRVTPTYIRSSPAIFCDSFFGFCYVSEVAHYMTQGEVTAGVTFRF